MRALLDENMPKALIRLLAHEIEARTVQQEGWSGLGNGELLKLASVKFDLFITTDRGIPHQQNPSDFGICILLLEAPSNRAEDLIPLVGRVKDAAGSAGPGTVMRISGVL